MWAAPATFPPSRVVGGHGGARGAWSASGRGGKVPPGRGCGRGGQGRLPRPRRRAAGALLLQVVNLAGRCSEKLVMGESEVTGEMRGGAGAH
jgi:hypothetical protein